MPGPTLLEDEDPAADGEEADAEQDDTADTDSTMPEDEPSDDGQSTETEPDVDEDAVEDGEDDEVVEAQMPGEDGDVEADADDSESSGILSKINVKAVVVIAAVVVGAVIVLRVVKNRGESNPQQAQQEIDEADGGGNPGDIDAPDDQPLKQDEQMMSALGMGQ